MKIARKNSVAVNLRKNGPHKPLLAGTATPIRFHKTKKMIIKTANIDLGMEKVVKWLNKFDSVVTKFCCEGGHKLSLDKLTEPYVVFTCDDSVELIHIVAKIGYLGTVSIRPPHNIRVMDYSITFPNKENLKIFIRGIKNEV